MDIRLMRGERITVAKRGADPADEISAIIQTDAGSLVAVEFQLLYGQPVPVAVAEAVLLARTSRWDRATAEATVRSVQCPGAWFELAGAGWQSSERRSSPRAALESACSVAGRSASGVRLEGTIVDVSAGGLRIAAARHVGEARLDVTFPGPAGKITLPCMLLAVEPAGDHVELRVRYERLTPPQQAAADWLAQAPGAVKRPAA